jgi:hypothetical protein
MKDLHKTVKYSFQLIKPYDGDVEKTINHFIELRATGNSFEMSFERRDDQGRKIVGKSLVNIFEGMGILIVVDYNVV